MEKFQKEFLGYRKKDVNQFIQETIEKTENFLEKLKAQERQIETLEKQIIHYQKSEADLKSFLENSAGDPVRIRNYSYQKASRMIEDAQRNADRIISAAIERSEELEQKVIVAEKKLQRFKNQLRTIIEQQTDIVEQIKDLEMER